ncbi:hypothetical protein [Sphingobacterium paludis]|uniref:Uncharacterized protein n=1 Tax=Sphingobacterium paludis TaxID=1476465 RepID=A0A4R7CV71_9SPHI|nr:hypothetical protein [Sphingobacterium paludis]TDS11747.1 hypothetical protein B0I21_10790 [Sphingobacterium paludis]
MRFEHGEHNESLCDHLLTNTPGKFNDWVVTTAFYACIHFVEHKIFPSTIDSEDFENFENYCDVQHNKVKNPLSKHALKAELVKKRIPSISSQYRWLKEACMNSRYTNYSVSDEKARNSNLIMKKIKEACSKDRAKAA